MVGVNCVKYVLDFQDMIRKSIELLNTQFLKNIDYMLKWYFGYIGLMKYIIKINVSTAF